jgi:hypothetical protein
MFPPLGSKQIFTGSALSGFSRGAASHTLLMFPEFRVNHIFAASAPSAFLFEDLCLPLLP